MQHVVAPEVVSAARAVTRSYLQQHPTKDERVRLGVESFLQAYEAVRMSTHSHDAAVYIGSKEARKVLSAPSNMRSFTYPSAPGYLFADVDMRAPVLGAYMRYLSSASLERIGGGVPSSVEYNGSLYVLHTPLQYRDLVGLGAQQEQLFKYVRHMCLYDVRTQSNPDVGRFPRTVLLTGPPGTGKSSLLANVCAEAQRLSRIAKKPLTTVFYDASSFSKYFGQATKVLKAKLARVQHPSGIGIFCIEDVDMVLQSRDDSRAFHGVLELQQYLMNAISGVEQYRGNSLLFLSTNRVQALDDALCSRVQSVLHINPFSQLAVHELFWQQHIPHAASSLARQSFDAQCSGRDLEAVLFAARERSTAAPSDAELAGLCVESRYAPLDELLLCSLIAERRAALRMRAQ